MEQFVKSLYDRLDSKGQMQLVCIMETENGIGHTIKINNDPHFPNSIAICIQGGLEGLFQAGIFRENKSGVMDYNIIIDDRGQDTSALEKNISVLNDLYSEFNIRVSHGVPEENGTEKPKKKKGLFAKLFGK